MFVYVVLILIVSLILFFSRENKTDVFFSKLILVIITLFSILRYDVGYDYESYYRIFYPYYDYSRVQEMEMLSQMFFVVSNKLSAPLLIFVIYAIITYLFVYLTLKFNGDNVAYSLFVYIAMFYLDSFSIIRQMAAVSVCFYGYKYIKNRSFFKYVIICIIASLIHKSACISILIYPVYWFFNLKIYFVVMSLVSLLSNFFIKALIHLNFYSTYLDRIDLYLGGNYIYICFIMIYIYIYINIKYVKDVKLCKVILIPLFFPMIVGAHMGVRIGLYFYIYILLVLPFVISCKKSIIRGIFYLVMCSYFFVMILMSSIKGLPSQYVPYKTIFDPFVGLVFRQR